MRSEFRHIAVALPHCGGPDGEASAAPTCQVLGTLHDPGRSQESLALTLGVDRATVQGWESARRPFTAVPVGQAISLRHRLTLLGAQPQLLALLTDATEADYLLGQIIDTQQAGTDLTAHPLAHTVLTHTLSELLAWTVTGRAPQPVTVLATPVPARRGPTADGPRLTADQRRRFFAGLQYLAACSSGRFDGPRSCCTGRPATWPGWTPPETPAPGWALQQSPACPPGRAPGRRRGPTPDRSQRRWPARTTPSPCADSSTAATATPAANWRT
jgi:hypothetical protein